MKGGETNMTLTQPIINTFNRVGIPYENLIKNRDYVFATNRFSGESVETSVLIAYLVDWVYQTSDDYEIGITKVKLSDFDRVRYFIAKVDPKAYSTCID